MLIANGGYYASSSTAWFWSGFGDYAASVRGVGWARTWLTQVLQTPLAQTYEFNAAVNRDWYDAQARHLRARPDLFGGFKEPSAPGTTAAYTFRLCYMQALAMAARTTEAYLFANPSGVVPNSAWVQIEFPWLTQS